MLTDRVFAPNLNFKPGKDDANIPCTGIMLGQKEVLMKKKYVMPVVVLLLFIVNSVFSGCSNSATRTPQNFPNDSALLAWLISQQNPPEATNAHVWLNHARQLQAAALGDGYIINVSMTYDEETELYTVLCEAILDDGSWYYWDPDYDDLIYWLDVDNL